MSSDILINLISNYFFHEFQLADIMKQLNEIDAAIERLSKVKISFLFNILNWLLFIVLNKDFFDFFPLHSIKVII